MPSLMVKGTEFEQERNSINYSFEKTTFYSQPEQLFESFGYKTVKALNYLDFKGYSKRLRVFLKQNERNRSMCLLEASLLKDS